MCSGGSSHISSLRARGKKGQADGLPNQVFHASGMLPFGGMLLRRSSTAALLALSVTFAGCRRIEEPISDRQATPSLPSATAAVAVSPPLAAPIELLRLPSSAYQALIFADDEAIELLTSSAAYRLLPGKAPEQRALDLGFAATVTRKSYVYWSRASIWSESRRAATLGGPTKLAALAAQPQRFVADIARDEFAFLSRSEDDRYAISKLEHGRVKRLYTSPGSIDALTMLGDALYFVERPGNAGWRIARLKLSGGDATFTASKTGRWPASLSGVKELVYYDGSRRDVLTLSPDLQQERTLAKDFICSPLAEGASVYCSTMEGVFELQATGTPRQVVAASRHLITNLAASSARLALVTDVGGQGQDQLAVNVVSLSAPNAAEAPR